MAVWKSKREGNSAAVCQHVIEATRKGTPEVNKQPKQLPERFATPGSWKPGQTGNPRGRPMASRQALADSLIPSVVEKWKEHGDDVLDRLVVEEPKAFAMLAANLLPKEVALSVEQRLPGNLAPGEYAQLRDVLALIQEHAPDGALPGHVLAVVETALRSEFARPLPMLEVLDAAPAIPPPPY
jgi:hypothetical protein